jgi:hypothetical protein
MKTYARIRSGLVAELLKTDGDITSMFNPELVWVDVSAQQDIAEGWQFDGTSFTAPLVAPTAAPAPTIAELQAQIAALGAKIAALSAKN